MDPAVTAEARPRPAGAQRREVAVLFADFSGFTALSEQMDPEDVHELMNRCFAGIGTAIQDEGGYIDKYIGDNVMALFGAPVAHEDDPARACRAALAIQEFVEAFSRSSERNHSAPLRMRIGVNFGLVLAGGVGSDVRMDYTVMGDAVNLASRLESAALPGSVLVSEEVHRQTRSLFKFGPPRELAVKGKEQPVFAFELLRESAAGDALEVSAGPLVGRDREIGFVQQCVQASELRRRWLEVRGEIGVGKSRLVREAISSLPEKWLIQVVATPAICRRPFGLLRRLIYSAFAELLGESIEAEDHFDSVLSRLDGRLEAFSRALWHLAAPSGAAELEPAGDPLSFRRTIEHGVLAFLDALASRFPNAVLFLDAYEHADDASATLLNSAFAEGSSLPIITASRTISRGGGKDENILLLEPLTETDAAALLTELAHGAELPGHFRQNILRRAGGVPLFLEEIVRTLVEHAALSPAESGAWSLQSPTAMVELPSSLRAAMVSRLDRLPPGEQEFLGYCSVQGVEFVLAAAERIHQLRQPSAMPGTLQSLRDKGILQWDGSTNSFAQPLMQEACYKMLARRDRRDLHERTADLLCDLAGGAANVAPEVLVFHYENSLQWEKAAEANLRAADRAQELFLNEDALAGYDRVMANLEKGDASSADARRLRGFAEAAAGAVHLRLGAYAAAEERANALLATAGDEGECLEAWRLLALVRSRTGGAQDAQALFSRIVAMSKREDPRHPNVISLAWYGLAELHHRAGRLEEALASLRSCRETATGRQRAPITLSTDLLEGQIAHTRGDFSAAANHYQRALELAEELGNVAEQARAMNNLGNVARDEGDYERAQSRYQEALSLWRRIGDRECIAGGHNNAGNLALSRGDFVTARDNYLESLDVCQRIGNVHGTALAHANLGILALEENDGPAAVEAATTALGAIAGADNEILCGLVEAVLGDAHLLSGDLEKAQSWFDKVRAQFTELTHPLAIATATRGLGRVAAREGRLNEARDLLSSAAAAFRRLQRSQEEARTVLDEARVRFVTGESDKARQLAESALTRFEAIHAPLDAERTRQFLVEIEACENVVP